MEHSTREGIPESYIPNQDRPDEVSDQASFNLKVRTHIVGISSLGIWIEESDEGERTHVDTADFTSIAIVMLDNLGVCQS